MGQPTSGVAHDFNNLLTVVLGNIAFLEKGLVKAGIDGKLVQRLGYMRAAAERGARLTDQLLSFSRRQRLEPKVIDLSKTVARMARSLAEHDGRRPPGPASLPKGTPTRGVDGGAGATESPEQTSKSHVTSCLRRCAARERWRGVGLAGSGCVQQTVA